MIILIILLFLLLLSPLPLLLLPLLLLLLPLPYPLLLPLLPLQPLIYILNHAREIHRLLALTLPPLRRLLLLTRISRDLPRLIRSSSRSRILLKLLHQPPPFNLLLESAGIRVLQRQRGGRPHRGASSALGWLDKLLLLFFVGV